MQTQVFNSLLVPAHANPSLFRSFFMAGFECSTHRLRSGRRLDMIAATRHDLFARQDYDGLRAMGLRVAREGVRWHLVEQTPGHYDFSSLHSVIAAARETKTQVLWDLCHFGWPDHLDVFKPEFASALAQYGAAFAQWLARELDGDGFFVPVNEISFLSWAAGDEGSLHPFVTGRGFDLKRCLVRAAIQTMDAIRSVHPSARFVHVDPIIHVIAHPQHPEEQPAAEAYRQLQYQSWDMLGGRVCPELGGHERYLDILGVNFYPQNQWYYNLEGVHRLRQWKAITRKNPHYRPLRAMLQEMHARYPASSLFIAETGAEGRVRRGWLRYVCGQVAEAIAEGVPIKGICLYPILNHPGWTNNRHCHNALWDYPDEQGAREIYKPLALELKQWQEYFEQCTNSANGLTAVEMESTPA